MSLRVLRKLQEKQSEENSDFSLDDVDTASNDEDKVKASNRFDLLLGGSPTESEAKEDDGIAEEDLPNRNSLEIWNRSKTDHLGNAYGARKKNRKKKRKVHAVKGSAVSSDDLIDVDCDEVERSVREVNALLGEVKHRMPKKSSDDKPGKNLLRVERKNLNPQNEMKRIFGARVVQATDSNRKRNRRSGTATSRVSKGTCIVQEQNHWSQHSKCGVSMCLVESTPVYIFKYQHNSTYQEAQFKFLEAVESLNPDNILTLLHSEPFHVDTLLQVSEIFRLADDASMSAQLIERAIYVLESVSHPLFNVASGNCRLQYRQQENRCLFISLFRHIMNVGMKGCYRTALELCKLLLSLSPDDDPLAVSLMLDFYAIRAQEYAWLVALYDFYQPSKNLSMLPNFSFSVPLALFHLSSGSSGVGANERCEKSKYQPWNTPGSPEELRSRADDMLQRAIIMFPGVMKSLLDKCNIQPDFNIDSHHYFGIAAQISMSKGLSQIINLYVGRNYHVWKELEVIGWLESNFKKALERIENGDELLQKSEEQRRLRYQGMPTAIYRHIILAEIKGVTATLPQSLANSPVMNYDPLPPPDSICDYSRPQSARPSASSSSILASFFRGLLPNYDPNTPEPTTEEGATGGDDFVNAGADLRASVNTLLEAIRNLFSNINLVEGGEGGGDEADHSEEEEDPPTH